LFVVFVFFTNTSVTTALHSMNPLPHINNDLSSLSNELHDLIDSNLVTLTQEHVVTVDPSHPRSLLLRVLRQQFTEHVEQQVLHLRQYTTHQHLRIHQFVVNSSPHYPNTNHTNSPHPNSDPDPNPNPNLNSNQQTFRRQRYNYYAVRKGHTRGIFESWEQCRPEVEGIANEFIGFYNLSDAQAYLNTDRSASLPE
jgi:hypothetical protein